jgi:hypothetical protein
LPSQAFTDHLEQLLADAEELEQAHADLRTGKPGRQYGLAALNRAEVVVCVSAWEAYVEQLVRESLQVLHPPSPPHGVWQALHAFVEIQLARFHTPNRDNVRALLQQALGLPDIPLAWAWRNCTATQAMDQLAKVMRVRHEIAHGVNPRPILHHDYASWLPGFFRRLARCTDDAVRQHLIHAHGIAHPWPP